VQLFRLRYFQIKRDLGYWIIIIAVACFYLSKTISETSQLNCQIFIGIVLFSLYNYHINRKDLNFIEHYLQAPKLQVCVNYNVLILPLSFALASDVYWKWIFFVHLFATLIGIFYVKLTSFKFLFIGKYISAPNFEWTAGVRKNFLTISVLLLIALILSPVKLFGVVALFILNFIFFSFYNYCEPLIMLNPEDLPVEVFLQKKIRFLIRTLLVINVPLLLVNCLFNPDIIWFNVGFMLAVLLLGACTVFIKYANYKPNTALRLNMDYLILTSSVVIFYLLPLGILIYISNKKKAIHNISNYIK